METAASMCSTNLEKETIVISYAQRQKEYRERRKIEKKRAKKIPKTNAQRQQQFRQNQKKIQQSETLIIARKKENAERVKRHRDRLKLKKQLDSSLSSKEDSLPTVVTKRNEAEQVHIQDDRYSQAAQSLSRQLPAASSTSQLIKRKPWHEENNEDTYDNDTNAHTSTSGAGDKYDLLGRCLATEMRQLDEHQRSMVEKIIYEAIHAGKIGSLNDNNKILVNSETNLSEPSDDDNMLCSEDGEIDSEVDAVETKVDIDEPEYLLVESFNEAREVSCSKGVGRKRDCKVNAEKLLDLNVPAEMSQLQIDKNICIKVETEENDNLKEAKLLQPFDEVLIKREIKTEDDDSHEDSKTEFVINKQQSSINVYRSTDAKRQRMDCTEEARIHLELQDSNVKR